MPLVLSSAGRVAQQLSKDAGAVQRLLERPDSTVGEADVAPLIAHAVDGMVSRAVMYVDTARSQWQGMHANAMLSQVCAASERLVSQSSGML